MKKLLLSAVMIAAVSFPAFAGVIIDPPTAAPCDPTVQTCPPTCPPDTECIDGGASQSYDTLAALVGDGIVWVLTR